MPLLGGKNCATGQLHSMLRRIRVYPNLSRLARRKLSTQSKDLSLRFGFGLLGWPQDNFETIHIGKPCRGNHIMRKWKWPNQEWSLQTLPMNWAAWPSSSVFFEPPSKLTKHPSQTSTSANGPPCSQQFYSDLLLHLFTLRVTNATTSDGTISLLTGKKNTIQFEDCQV